MHKPRKTEAEACTIVAGRFAVEAVIAEHLFRSLSIALAAEKSCIEAAGLIQAIQAGRAEDVGLHAQDEGHGLVEDPLVRLFL